MMKVQTSKQNEPVSKSLLLNVPGEVSSLFTTPNQRHYKIKDFIRAWPQKARTVCHPCREYRGKTSSCARRWHRNDSAPPEQLVSRRTWRPQAGCWRWMQDVVCQLVGNGVVPWHVMNGKGSSASVSHPAPFWSCYYLPIINKFNSPSNNIICIIVHLKKWP